jgi:polyisoprenoid-binding protein YceI
MSATATATTTWNLDPAHSTAEFKVRHMMISNVKGHFKGVQGVLRLNQADPALSSVEATIPIGDLATGDEQRDGHLKSADFLDAAQFPTMTFKSTRITAADGDGYNVLGDLTLHGVTQPVTFAVSELSAPGKDPWGNLRIGLAATAKIHRKDFGLTWNTTLETGGVLVGEDVALALDVQFIRA